MEWIINTIQDPPPPALDAVLYIWDNPEHASLPVQEAEDIWSRGCRLFFMYGPGAERTHDLVDLVFVYDDKYGLDDYPTTCGSAIIEGESLNLKELLWEFSIMPCPTENPTDIYYVRILTPDITPDEVRKALPR